MVNHFRTLLLNETADPTAVQEQYIDPNFRPIELTPEESAIRNLILEPQFPRDYRNFVATLMTRLAYSGTQVDKLEALDKRRTIDFATNASASLQTRLQLFRDNNASALNLVGTFVPNLDKGYFEETYEVLRTGAAQIQVTNARTAASRLINLTFSNGSTDLYRLDPNRPLSVQFMGVDEVPAGLFARVVASAPMSYDAMAALSRLKSNDRVSNIFPLVTGGMELRNEYDNSSLPHQAFSAVLIAYALSVSRRL